MANHVTKHVMVSLSFVGNSSESQFFSLNNRFSRIRLRDVLWTGDVLNFSLNGMHCGEKNVEIVFFIVAEKTKQKCFELNIDYVN